MTLVVFVLRAVGLVALLVGVGLFAITGWAILNGGEWEAALRPAVVGLAAFLIGWFLFVASMALGVWRRF